jgi:hypothetical protein
MNSNWDEFGNSPDEVYGVIDELERYAHVSVVTIGNGPEYPIIGQYRGRIEDENHYWFNREGKAIWVTSDSGFEAMILIADIISLRTVD